MYVAARRKYVIFCVIAGLLALLLLAQQDIWVSVPDSYCSQGRVGDRVVCVDSPERPCSANEGWACRAEKGDRTCVCVMVGKAPSNRTQ